MLPDTDVLIWYMRGDGNARDLIKGLSDITLSVVTYMELVQGMRNKAELAALDAALARWKVKPEAILAGKFRRTPYCLFAGIFSVAHYEWRTP